MARTIQEKTEKIVEARK